MSGEQPRRTPAWVGVSTGNPAIDRAFAISVDLVEDLTRTYHAAGKLRGWLPVSGGVRGRQADSSDTRDSAHAVQMAAYLWGQEDGIAATMESAMLLAYVDPRSGAIRHPCCPPEVFGDLPNIVGMFMRCVADTHRYFGVSGQLAETMRRALLTAEWVLATFDPEGSGLLDCRNERGRTFFAAHLGEPSHFPPNHDPKSKTVVFSMAFCVWLQRMGETARRHRLPEAERLAAILRRYAGAIEERAWSDRGGYYRCQYDRIADKWYFSMCGLSEQSRETDIMPYYCAAAPVAAERRRSVARHLDGALTRDRAFPMPIYYPPYPWYSPHHPIYNDAGNDAFVLGGAWDTPYFHCVQLLSEVGLIEALELAVRKRAEAIVRDGDCLEWFHLDGTADTRTGYHRDRYLVCATAQIAATIEGLFGVTPAEPGFAAINIAPALPFFRRHRHSAPLSEADQRPRTLGVALPGARRLDLSIGYNEVEEKLRIRTNRLDVPGRFRIPIDLAERVRGATWEQAPVAFAITRSMDRSFVSLEHVLDGGELVLELDPHPQKGKGTTPELSFAPDGRLLVTGCGSEIPSPPCGGT